jgi:hypothetical protein
MRFPLKSNWSEGGESLHSPSLLSPQTHLSDGGHDKADNLSHSEMALSPSLPSVEENKIFITIGAAADLQKWDEAGCGECGR